MENFMIIGLIILTLVLVFWAIIDITKSRFKNPTLRTVWLIAVLIFPIIGSILYFQLRRTLITKEPIKFQPDFNKTKAKP